MEPTENRRFNDTEISKLVERVGDLEAEVHRLRVRLEEHEVLDEQTHAKMMIEMALVQSKIDLIMKELMAHTKTEESKFDQILKNQEQHKSELSRLTVDTAPAVNATKWIQYTGVLVAFIKDTLAPLVIGGGAVYLYLHNKGFF